LTDRDPLKKRTKSGSRTSHKRHGALLSLTVLTVVLPGYSVNDRNATGKEPSEDSYGALRSRERQGQVPSQDGVKSRGRNGPMEEKERTGVSNSVAVDCSFCHSQRPGVPGKKPIIVSFLHLATQSRKHRKLYTYSYESMPNVELARSPNQTPSLNPSHSRMHHDLILPAPHKRRNVYSIWNFVAAYWDFEPTTPRSLNGIVNVTL
jgi:hypothetical protein